MIRALFVLATLAVVAMPASAAVQQQREEWPAVSRDQSRENVTPKRSGRVTTNFCNDLCYCWNDPKITTIDQAACVYDQEESRYECTALMFYSCAKKTVEGRVTCRTCI